MITIDKYGQSVNIFDGSVNMFFDKVPIKRGVYIIKATGMVFVMEYVQAPFTDFIINGVPITTIEEFTTQFALAIPLDDSGGGSIGSLQQVTDVGDQTDHLIVVAGLTTSNPGFDAAVHIYNAAGNVGNILTQLLTNDMGFNLPNSASLNITMPASVNGNFADDTGDIVVSTASGSFVSQDNKTITVTNGIITSIS